MPELITLQTDLTPRIDTNPAAVYLAGLVPGSRRVMRLSLNQAADLLTGGQCDALTMPWAGVRFGHVMAVRSELIKFQKRATVNRTLSAIRGVLKTAWQLGLMTAEDYHRAAGVENLEGETIIAGRALSRGEISALAEACNQDNTPAGVRDAAVISLAYSAGLRRAEIVALDLADYDPQTGSLKVHGKGNRERITYLVNGAALAMADWLQLRGDHPGPLFLPINRGHAIGRGRITTQAIYKLMAKRMTEARVADFSPHDMRRTFISDLLDAGADIATVAKMAGHNSVTTTARYDRRGEATKAQAAKLLFFPYQSRDPRKTPL